MASRVPERARLTEVELKRMGARLFLALVASAAVALAMAEAALERLGDDQPGLGSAVGLARIIVDERWPVIIKVADELRHRKLDYAAFETMIGTPTSQLCM